MRRREFHELAEFMLAFAKLFLRDLTVNYLYKVAKPARGFVEHGAELREFVFAIDRDFVFEFATCQGL